MEHSLNNIKHISQQQPNEKLQKLVEDYQLSNRRQTIHLDNDVTLPYPDVETKSHVRQRSLNKKKRDNLYQDYTNSLAQSSKGAQRTSLNTSLATSSASSSSAPSSAAVPTNRVAIDVPHVRSRAKSFNSRPDQSHLSDFRHCRPIHTQFRSSLLHSFDIDADYESQTPDDNEDTNTQHHHDYKKPADTLSFVGIRNLIFLILVTTNFRVCLKLAGYVTVAAVQDFFETYLLYNRDVFYLGIAALASLTSLTVAYAIEAVAVGTVSPSSKLGRLMNLTKVTRTVKKKKSLTNIQAKATINLNKANKYSTGVFVLHAINVSTYLIATNMTVYNDVHNCLVGLVITVHSFSLALKLISYYLANRELRELYAKASNQKSLSSASTLIDPKDAKLTSSQQLFMPAMYSNCQYPNNITYSNICQFWSLPTLVYQPTYPFASEKVTDYKFIGHKVVEIITSIIISVYLNNYYALPVFEKLLSLLVYEDTSLSSTVRSLQIVELLLKLSTISGAIWILLYYSFFHNFLNILAEFSQFGDRHFYYNWWNADSIYKYWQRWNRPLKCFINRHFLTAKASHNNKTRAVTFLVFAVITELLVGIPTHNFLGLAFLSVSLQIPLIYITEKLNPAADVPTVSFTGNCLFWCSFLIGSPLCFMFYFLSWCAKNNFVDEYSFRR